MTSVRFLGSGDAFGSGGRLQTCIHVEADGAAGLLIDCGASALVGMKRHDVDPGSIGTILVSHLHGDHFGGIPFFVLDAQFARREAPLTIAGPPGIRERITQTMEVLFPGSSCTKQRFEISYVELPATVPTQLAGATVAPHEVVHASGAPAYALRVEAGGRVIAYSGDSEWCDALPRAASGADLLIAEAYYYEKQVRYHLDYRTLLAHRDELRCERIVLTHMSSDMLAHLNDVEFETANDGLRIEL